MKMLLKPILWLAGKLNPKMHVIPEQIIPLESLKILDRFLDSSTEYDSGTSMIPHHAILDLGGGGEGIIGQLMGSRVTAIDIRPDELNDAPGSPVKVVADARNLPFEDNTFNCATAFYFLMYLKSEDYTRVFQEAFRVLRPSGHLVIWDANIPLSKDQKERLFIAPVKVHLPQGPVTTAYGTPWQNKALSADQLKIIAQQAGFTVVESQEQNHGFILILKKRIV